MTEMLDDEAELVAKSEDGQSLLDHTNNVIKTIISVYEKLPPNVKAIDGLLDAAIVAATFHDVGKAHPEFQKYLRGQSNTWQKRRHELISSSIYAMAFQNHERHEATRSISSGWSVPIWLAILLHHKNLGTGAAEKSTAFLTQPIIERIPFKTGNTKFNMDFKYWELNLGKIAAIFSNLKELMENEYHLPTSIIFDEKTLDASDFTISEFLEHYLGELDVPKTVLDDYDIANTSPWSALLRAGYQHLIFPDFATRFNSSILLGLLKTADHMASGDYMPPEIPMLSTYDLKKTLYPFQKETSSIHTSVILRAPTGSGKTEAALAWAQHNQAPGGRLVYVLPFQASLNAMYKRLHGIMHEARDEFPLVGISHSKNLEFLSSFFEDTDYTKKDAPFSIKSIKDLAKEVYYPVQVSTAHQLLRFILFGKGWESLLLSLQEATVIFDEIHAYEPRILGLIVGMIKILRRYLASKFIIMTATLPKFIIELIKTDAFPDKSVAEITLNEKEPEDKKILERKRHHLSIVQDDVFGFLDDVENFDIVKNRYDLGAKQLFVCNTVGTAQKIYDIFKEDGHFPEDDLLLFHSRFNSRDRVNKERRLLPDTSLNDKAMTEEIEELHSPRILIATQVVEVSLDISFDYGYFEVAPIDALIQRMGRINRQGISMVDPNAEPNVVIFTNAIHDTSIYNQDIVEKTRFELEGVKGKPISEMEWQTVVDRVYPEFSRDAMAEYLAGRDHEVIKNYEDKLEVGFQQEWVAKVIDKADKQVEVLPKECLGEFEQYWKEKKFIEARKLLVSANTWVLRGEINYNSDYITRYHVFLLKSQRFRYSREYGLQFLDDYDRN